MKTAKQLTSIVASTSVDRASFQGVSDHVPHAQRVKVQDQEFVIATFNVLHPEYMYFQNGIPCGKPLPNWLKMEDQAGLESIPSSHPDRQNERQAIIIEAILKFIEQHPSLVLCIQEGWPALYDALDKAAEHNFLLSKEQADWTCLRFTICKGIPEARLEANSVYLGDVLIENVHLRFKTEATLNDLRAIMDKNVKYTFVVGDFNVQTQYLSVQLLEEGVCTDTLTELVARIESPECKVRFALHPKGWTNWNVRKNCADRENNRDHFDNIMLICPPEADEPLLEPVPWEIVMQ